MYWFWLALTKYATFSGRSRRKEFWMFFLFFYIFTIAFTFTGFMIDLAFEFNGIIYASVYVLFTLLMTIPSLAVTVRRLHDIGKSGWFYFVIFIPLIGAVWFLILMIQNGDVGNNQYGPDPKV